MSRFAVIYALAISLWMGGGQLCHGQEIDTVIFDEDRSGDRIIDQIQDPAERSALEELLAPAQPAQRLSRARQFLEIFPASAFLSVALDVAARSAFQISDPAGALRYAQFSLKLLPENPLLLVLTAELHADLNQPEAAVRDAEQALQYLGRFARPAAFSPRQWKKLAAQARASAFRTKARAAAAAGFSAEGEQKRKLLRQARGMLLEAVESDPNDQDAVRWLERMHDMLGDSGDGSAVPEASSQIDGPSRIARGAGTGRCQSCHASQHAVWSKTGMARMFRPIDAAQVIGKFPAKFHEKGITAARMLREDGRYFFEFPDLHGWKRYEAQYVIGSKWQQAYATRLPDGRIEVFPLQFNLREQRWLNFWAVIDPPGSQRSQIENFVQLTGDTTYQKHCAPCHTSQLRMTTPLEPASANALFREGGINCEMCHGPSKEHAAQWETGKPHRKSTEEPPLDFTKLSASAYVAVCAQCHRQSAMFQRGPRGEMNYSGMAPAFPAKASSRPLLEFSRKAFYKDGRFRESTFITEALERSKCYRVGGAHCGHCHDPHPSDAATNPVSLKYPDHSDQMCVQCHADKAADPQLHTHHRNQSTGSRCVNCHMPKVMHSLLFQARTHTIDDIPDPALTIRFGASESPNACLDCHTGERAQWVQRTTEAWWGWRGSELR